LGVACGRAIRLYCTGLSHGPVSVSNRALVSKGIFGFGAFECDNLLVTYEELKAKVVEFTKEPTQEFYGFEALFKDDSGNWFSLGQKAE
jgi:hypothetical protein